MLKKNLEVDGDSFFSRELTRNLHVHMHKPRDGNSIVARKMAPKRTCPAAAPNTEESKPIIPSSCGAGAARGGEGGGLLEVREEAGLGRYFVSSGPISAGTLV